MPFDFTYNEATGSIEKLGHYSRCEPHEATREEALLWRRVQELEKVLDERCPVEVLHLISKIPRDAGRVAMCAEDFAAIRQHAWHRVEMVVGPLNRQGILGSWPIIEDGSPRSVWISVERGLARGDIHVYPVGDDRSAL